MNLISSDELRNNQKYYFDKAAGGDKFIVNSKNRKNIVLMSEEEYNELIKTREKLSFDTTNMTEKIERGYKDIKDGKGIAVTMQELERMVNQ